MGNCVDERKPTLSLFDPIELAALNRIFDERCDLNPKYALMASKHAQK